MKMTACTKCGTTEGRVRDYVGQSVLCGTCSGYGDPYMAPALCGHCGDDIASVTHQQCRTPDAITADDVRTARLDCNAHGRLFDDVRLAVAQQVLRSIRDEQPTASAVIRALADAALERIK